MNIRLFLSVILLSVVSSMVSAMPKVVAHRGYWQTDGSAQNSIRSLVKADSIGCYAAEFDVWITADGELVVNHNADIAGHIIEKETLRSLRDCRLANGETLPTLEQYLDAAKNLSVNLILELKPHSDNRRENVAVGKIVKMLADKGLTERVVYITFSRNAFDALVAQGGRPVFYLNGVQPSVLKEIGGAGPDYHINVFRKNPDWIGRFKEMGMPINIWTVNTPEDIAWCIAHGADFITTDRPELAMQMIREAEAPTALRVMTFNLRAGSMTDIDCLAQYIRDSNPDFVALQEVDVNTHRSVAPSMNGRNMVAELAGKTGMFGSFARTLNFAGGYYGIGILSKHPCVASESVELPNPKNAEPRAMLKGLFEIGGKRKVVFASTHLDVTDSTTRKLQAEYIMERLKKEDVPVIIGGDFNAVEDSGTIKLLQEEMTELTDRSLTFPADKPAVKLDYLFGYPKDAVRLESTFVPADGKPLSDHLPVISDVVVLR